MEEILRHPFTLGFITGLCICLLLFISSTIKIREMRNQYRQLQKQLHLKMEMDAEANENRKNELERIRKENENLRITIQNLRDKPGRKELELLYIYDKALQFMFQNAPGFAPAWQTTLKEAEQEITRYQRGIIPFLKRVINPSASHSLNSESLKMIRKEEADTSIENNIDELR